MTTMIQTRPDRRSLCPLHPSSTADVPPLRLLGPVMGSQPSGGLRLMYRKGWALLGYLLVEHGRRHRRTELAAMLWPALEDSAALTNLRQVVCDLRRKLLPLVGADVLLVGRDSLAVQLDALQRISDLQLVEDLAMGAAIDDPEALRWLLASGQLLETVEEDGFEEFGHWLVSTRQWYLQQWRRAVDRLRVTAQQQGNWRLALDCVRSQIQVDPWDEALHRERMSLYCAMGQAQLALASYTALEQVLQRELGVDPQPETRDMVGRIRQQALI